MHPHHTQWNEEEVEAWLRDTPPLKWPSCQYRSSSAHPPTQDAAMPTSFWPSKKSQSSSGGMMKGTTIGTGLTFVHCRLGRAEKEVDPLHQVMQRVVANPPINTHRCRQLGMHRRALRHLRLWLQCHLDYWR